MPQIFDNLLDTIKRTAKKIENRYSLHLRNKQVNETLELMECAGELAVCENELKKIIRIQSRAVREAREEIFDESMQLKTVKEAAIGFMLIRDARFAVKTMNSRDSFQIAHDMLESAAYTIQGDSDSAKRVLTRQAKKHKGYEHLYSDDAYKKKNDILEEILEGLIETGDIELCLKKRNDRIRKERQNKTSPSSPSSPSSLNELDLPNSADTKMTDEYGGYDEQKFKEDSEFLESYDGTENVDLSNISIDDLIDDI